MSPSVLLDRITRGRGDLAIRYTTVSVIGVTITQLQLALYVGILDWDATWSNVLAVSLCTVPVFLLNKWWVWSHDGKISFRREILPFWVFTLAGLLLSTAFVAIAENMSDSTLLVMAANIAGFGVLWVAKFLFLDKVMFGHSEKEEVLSQEAPAT
jgi:putative flippase GtrA